MDFQKLAESFSAMTCVVSVERTPAGGCGDIRLVAGNKRYIDLLEHPELPFYSGATEKESKPFIPNSRYEDYLPKDMAFEDVCFRAAVMKEPVHTYYHSIQGDLWFNVFVMPLEYEENGLCYCTYTAKHTELANIDLTTTYNSSTAEDVLRTCIKLHGSDDFKKAMDEVIEDTRVTCGAEVCTVMLTDSGTSTCSILAKSVRDRSVLKTVTQFVNFYDIAKSWLATIGNSDCLIIKSEKDMQYIKEVNNPWYLTLVESGVESVVMFPLRFQGDVLGFIWATNFDTDKTLRIKETLELTAFFLSSQIAGYKMMTRLERLGYTDLQTGVNNRNAMNNRISDIISGKALLSSPFGVIFADLNGLKQVNDTQGHAAGDLVLKKAAIMLQEMFENENIYRAGGDEFVILMPNCEKETLEQKVNALRNRRHDEECVSFAVGSYFAESVCDIRDAMHIADENMYADKERYYTEHPERQYR